MSEQINDPTEPEDVEGHRRARALDVEEDVEGHRAKFKGLVEDEDDVEGHRMKFKG